MPDIHLKCVRKEFGANQAAVEDVEFTVRSGELLTLVGPSGSGKSTLLRLIAGLERPTSGRIFFGDRDVTDSPAAKRDISMVFQGENHFPHLTVRENLVVGLRLRRKPKAVIDSRLNATAGTLGLADLLDRWPGSLSGGESQRVALGRVYANQSSIGLLDEPLVHVDPSQRGLLHRVIRQLHDQSRGTLIHVTHDQVEAMSLGQRMAVMHRGRVLQVDTPRRVYLAPASTVVATFVGYPPMNLFSARVAAGQIHGVGIETHSTDLEDGSLVVGVRPEILRWDVEGEICMNGRVRAVEFLGGEQIVEFERDGTSYRMRTAADHEFSIGQTITSYCDRKDLHFFSADGQGKRIECRGSLKP